MYNPDTNPMTNLLTTEQVAEYLQVSPSTIRRWRANGTGPTPTRIGRQVRYHITHVHAWIAKQAAA